MYIVVQSAQFQLFSTYIHIAKGGISIKVLKHSLVISIPVFEAHSASKSLNNFKCLLVLQKIRVPNLL